MNLYMFLFCIMLHNAAFGSKWFERQDILEYVIVHFDFKGAPPKLSYLTSILKDLRELGVNGLLLEYEDMFPFEGKLQDISAINAYNKQRLKIFLREAVKQGFELIPFVQTIGHLDFAMKHKKFKDFKEKCFPDSHVPKIILLHEILKQIIKFHKSIAPLKYFHIGCDILNQIDECNSCRERDSSFMKLVERYVLQTTKFVHTLSPDTKILMWDEMFRGHVFHSSKSIFNQVQPVTWQQQDVKIDETTWQNYKEHFESVWAASAFKGADGVEVIFPNLSKRYNNHRHWIQVINNPYLRYTFKGIILTGLSRQSHGAPLYELLSSSIPSLYLNLLMIQTFKNNLKNQISVDVNKIKNESIQKLKNILNCDDILEDDNSIDDKYFSQCNYPASEINRAIIDFKNSTYFTTQELEKIRHVFFKSMYKYYDEHVAVEYFNENVKTEK